MPVKPVPGGTLIGTPGGGTHSFTSPPDNWESDEAIDVGVPIGTPVYAVESGTIGQQFGSLGDPSGRFAGLRLHLEVPGDEFYYAHLSRFAPGIHPGSQVTEGQLLGYSGEASGVAHLHFAEELDYPISGPNAPVMRFAPGGSLTGLPSQPSIPGAGGTAPGGDSPPDQSPGNDCGSGPPDCCIWCPDVPFAGKHCALTDPICKLKATKPANPVESAGKGAVGAVGSAVGAIDDVAKALGFIFSIRFLEILGGGTLLLLGLYLLGKQLQDQTVRLVQ